MRIKINGRDIDHGDRVTIETSEFPNDFALLIISIGLAVIAWIAHGGAFV
jgi:hypothetical protein